MVDCEAVGECGFSGPQGWRPFDAYGELDWERRWWGSPLPSLEEWQEEGETK